MKPTSTKMPLKFSCQPQKTVGSDIQILTKQLFHIIISTILYFSTSVVLHRPISIQSWNFLFHNTERSSCYETEYDCHCDFYGAVWLIGLFVCVDMCVLA